MKRIFYLGSFLLLLSTYPIMAQEGSGKIKIRITNESGRVIEKEYDSAGALANDPELKEMGIDVEATDGGIKMMSKGTGNQSVVIQQNSGKGGGNQMYIEQGPSRPDSMEMGHRPRPPHTPGGMHEQDSLSREEHLRIMHMRDSLLSQHDERREERMKAMEERRAEMRRHMEERGRGPGRGSQLIIIEDLAKEEASKLGIKNAKLQLEELKITPRPEEGSLDLRFQTHSNDQVRIKFSEQDGRLLLDDVFPLGDKSFGKTFSLEQFGKGVYFLQIIQNRKVLGRKIRVE